MMTNYVTMGFSWIFMDFHEFFPIDPVDSLFPLAIKIAGNIPKKFRLSSRKRRVMPNQKARA